MDRHVMIEAVVTRVTTMCPLDQTECVPRYALRTMVAARLEISSPQTSRWSETQGNAVTVVVAGLSAGYCCQTTG